MQPDQRHSGGNFSIPDESLYGTENEVQMEPRQLNLAQTKGPRRQYRQERYRWVVIALVSLSFAINNIANNAIIPIASKIIKVYDLDETYANLPIQISFLVNPIMNFTAGSLIDSRGLGVSFRIGTLLYAIGLFGYVCINHGYHFVLVGSIIVSIGQPLIMNTPAKVACFWFLNKNVFFCLFQRTLATGVINAINIVTLGISLVFPAIFVDEDSYSQNAKDQIQSLYSKYFFAAIGNCILVMIFMRERPEHLPSAGAEQEKTSFTRTIQIIRNDYNLWKFFGGSILLYGTFLSFGSTSNLLFKPFGFEDTQIAIFGVSLLVSGIIGSVLYTLYIKRTLKYKRVISVACTLAMIFFITNMMLINFVPEQRVLITILILGMGFNLLPMVPISHDLGCELAFPVGQAQVVGIMAGVAMLYTVVLTLSISAIVGFGTSRQSAINMAIYIFFFGLGSLVYNMVEIDLKRRKMEEAKDREDHDNENNGEQLGNQSANGSNIVEPLNVKRRQESQNNINNEGKIEKSNTAEDLKPENQRKVDRLADQNKPQIAQVQCLQIQNQQNE